MAYMNQEKKKELAPGIKAVLKKYNMKGSISVEHHSALVVTLSSGPIDFGETNRDVNTYWINDHYTGTARDFLSELHAEMNGNASIGVENHDNSDIMTDYFDVGWYCYIRIGKWNKDYAIT